MVLICIVAVLVSYGLDTFDFGQLWLGHLWCEHKGFGHRWLLGHLLLAWTLWIGLWTLIGYGLNTIGRWLLWTPMAWTYGLDTLDACRSWTLMACFGTPHVLQHPSRLGPRSGSSKYCDTYAVVVVPPHKDRCIHAYVYTYVLSSDVVSLWPSRFSRVLQAATAGFGCCWHAFQRAVFVQLVFG